MCLTQVKQKSSEQIDSTDLLGYLVLFVFVFNQSPQKHYHQLVTLQNKAEQIASSDLLGYKIKQATL